MPTGLGKIFDRIPQPAPEPTDKQVFAVVPVPGHSSYLLGRDRDSRACLLVTTDHKTDHYSRLYPPIRLENLDAQFKLRCHLRGASEPEREGTFTVIRCRESEGEMTRYFLWVCETILQMLGRQPTQAQVSTAVIRLAAIFQKVRQPAARPINGLFGELFLVFRSRNAVRTLTAWRTDENARFDFSINDVRLDVKAASSRSRLHIFSYDQCNPPPGTVAVVASLHVERTSGGTSLESIISQIAARVSAHADLLLKLHETVAATLGASLNDGLARRFDLRLAESSLQFLDLYDVPAIRGPLPAGVTDVHFRSDLSALSPLSTDALIERDPVFLDLLA